MEWNAWISSTADLSERVGGLEPRTCVCVGSGFSREELKADLLSRVPGFISDVFVTPTQVVLRAATTASGIRLQEASPSLRREVLRRLWVRPAVLGRLNHLKSLRRRADGVHLLDRALQSGRLAWAHAEEERAYEARLAQLSGDPSRAELRAELRFVTGVYESVLRECGFVDLPMALEAGISALQDRGTRVGLPEQVIWCDARVALEPREKLFWELLATRTELVRVQSEMDVKSQGDSRSIQAQIWHTLDDAAERLADSLLDRAARGSLSDLAVVIPPAPEDGAIRRVLQRTFRSRGLELADSRDPNHNQLDEAHKRRLLPWQMVAGGFKREQVWEWLRGVNSGRVGALGTVLREISERGIVSGLQHYSGGRLEGLHRELVRLDTALREKRNIEAWAETFLSMGGWGGAEDDESFWRRFWSAWIDETKLMGDGARKLRLAYVVERLQERLRETPAPPPILRAVGGVRIYRAVQVPARVREKEIHVFGVSSAVASLRAAELATDDLWWNARERERLASEFGVRSFRVVREERKRLLSDWIARAECVHWWDARHDATGAERDEPKDLWEEMGLEASVDSFGAHSRWMGAHSPRLAVQDSAPRLDPLDRTEITASELEMASRCSFRALAQKRWRLEDIRQPEMELWKDQLGTLLHRAIELGLRARRDGQILGLGDALEQAWQEVKPKGLVRNRKREQQARVHALKILERFWDQEAELRTRWGAGELRELIIDDVQLRLQLGPYSVRGVPDRVLETPRGLLVQDFKSTGQGSLPSAAQMLEGYRLQTPFYALAAQVHFQKEVAAVQFVSLTPAGGRNKGIFFEAHNGKVPGAISNLRGNSTSLLKRPPGEVWTEFLVQIEKIVRTYAGGEYAVDPHDPNKDCRHCAVSNLCGIRRAIRVEEEDPA